MSNEIRPDSVPGTHLFCVVRVRTKTELKLFVLRFELVTNIGESETIVEYLV